MSATQPLFAFFGTPHLGVWVLDALEKHGMLPALVVTAPDTKAGRGLALTPSPTKQWAQEHGIDVLTPDQLDEALVVELRNTEWDVFVVAAYTKKLPKDLLDLPRHGVLNVHPSLLPKFRGPSPILSAILADEHETGVSIMQLSEELDAGLIVAQARVEIAEEDWPPKAPVLEEMLCTEGGNLLAEILPDWIEGKIVPQAQDEQRATYTKKFKDSDALIDLAGDAQENFLKVRAFSSNPRAYFVENGKRVIITDAQYQDGKLKILKVIPEGKKEQNYRGRSSG